MTSEPQNLFGGIIREMYFHTHVYYSKRVDKDLTPLKVLGSMLPDLALTSAITWDDLHKKKNIMDFFAYVEKSNSSFSPLLKGVNYHNTLDYFTHLKYKNSTPGYAYASITPKLNELTKKALNIPQERVRASCHNLIESGVEYYLLNEDPDLKELVKNSIEEVDMRDLAKLLAGFYGKGEKQMLESLNILFSFATKYDLKNIDGCVNLGADLNKYYLKVEIDRQLTRKALELSFEITKYTYKEFIESSISSKDTEIKDCN